MNISATSGRITIKIYLKHYRDGGKTVLSFGPDPIRTLVSMATDNSHRVIMGKASVHSSAFTLIGSSSFFLAGNKDNHKVWTDFEFKQDPITDCRVNCPGESRKIPMDL